MTIRILQRVHPVILRAFLLAAFVPAMARGANVSLTASDAGGSSSLTSAGKWSDSQPPSAANDYFTGAFFVRTPQDAGGITTTFPGNSLTLQAPSGQNAPMRSLLYKGGAGDTIVINNLTNAAGAVLNNGGSGNVGAPTFTGNLWTIAGNSTILSDQGPTIIGYPLAGTAILTNTSGQGRTITYTGNLSGFTGKFYIFSSCTVAFGSGSSPLGNPSVFTPDQILIGSGCTLADNSSLTFNNANSGITLLGPGNATISPGGNTSIAEPITDVTNGVSSASSLTVNGSGILLLSGSNSYSGGTIISAGTLQLGTTNSLPIGNVTDNSWLDLNSNSVTINVLSGSGIVDTIAGGTPTLTMGANGGSGTFSGTIENIGGILSLVKVGAGSQTLSGPLTYSGSTLVAGGTLNVSSAAGVPSSPGNLTVSNGAVLNGDASTGNPFTANNIVIGTNSTYSLTLNSVANGMNGNGSLTLQDNAVIGANYGSLAANPTAPAINMAGGITVAGTNVTINITGSGLQVGTFTLIKYTGTPLGSIANFVLSPPPGVAAILVNNQGSHSIDVQITSIPNLLTWYGEAGPNWDLTTVNWKTALGADTVFRQYTNNGIVAGDAVTFDDSLTNDFVNAQPTNINLTGTFYAFPVVVNSTLPYTISGPGGITGVTSLIKSNSGSLTLTTSNSFTGGVSINDSGALYVSQDSALGASSGKITLNGGILGFVGNTTNSRPIAMPVTSTLSVATNVTTILGGVISGGSTLNTIGNGTLILTAKETFTGDLFAHSGTLVIDTGGAITNGSYHDVGQNGTDNATLTLRGTGSFGTTSDFNAGDLDSSIGTVNVQGSATLVANQIFIGSANATGSTASGTVNQSGGTVTEVSTAVGAFAIGGRTSTSGVGVYNMSGGTLTANSGIRVGGSGIGTLNQSGGTINAIQGINIARLAGSFGTNNLNGGTLATFNVATSTGNNAVFNFNGGTLQAAFNPPSATWFSGNIQANVLAGGAVIDSSTNNVTVSTPLLAGSPNGGLTKKGSAALTLTGINTFTGPITNSAGTLFLNSASTYSGGVFANAGTLQISTANTLTGPTTVTNGAVLSVSQVGSGTLTMGDLTLNGGASGLGATIAVTPTSANNPAVPVINCGTLTLNGTNTISLAAVNVGPLAVIKYTGSLAGSGTLTNLSLPQGATGTISNDTTHSILYAVVTSTGPGLVWTGTNSAALNVWNINATTNWLVNGTPTSYHQIITPGDAVTFNDFGSGLVTLNTNVAPAGIVISNNSVAYTFSGNCGISGSTGLRKLGTGTALLNLTNDTYLGDTVISNGTLQVANAGVGASMSPNANLTIGPSGTLQLSSLSANTVTAVGELNGAGIIDYTGGNNSILSFGGANGGTWNGTIRDHNGGGLSLTKSGTGTLVIGGTNNLNNGDFFNAVSQVQLNGGTTILTNGSVLNVGYNEFWVAQGAGSTSTVVVAGSMLSVSNNWLVIGRGDATANGTMIVNSGTVHKMGNNQLVVGSSGATGTLIVNGGQVLNNADLWLGEGATGSGTLFLNGGLVQADVVRPNTTPVVASIAYFNGGTLQATTNSSDFLQVTSMIMSNGLVLDDGGYSVSLATAQLQAGDAFNGGFIKKGSGTVYLNSVGHTYTGPTVVTNGVLAGIGSAPGAVIVAPNGRIGGGDSVNLGTFTALGNITMQGGALIRINKDTLQNDVVASSGNIAYGGALVVSNLSTTALAPGDSFTVFSPGTHSGNFNNIVGSPGTGLAYSFDPATSKLSVVTSTIATNPTNITFSVSGGSLTMTWPSDHTGWTLQSNAVNIAVPGDWFDYPASTGSRDVNQVTIPVSGTSSNVFFRLKYP